MMEKWTMGDQPTQDERILAALAHASVILPFWGLIGAFIIWATQREKSRLVRFQALQGAAYQLTLVLCGFLCLACYMCSFLGTFLVQFGLAPLGIMAVESGSEIGIVGLLVPMLSVFIPFLVIGVLAFVALAFVLYGLYGAVQVIQGHDFRYVIIGRRLERYLAQEKSSG
jgi:uncharacterized Tic20 family protein